jgi:hypothetical protein
MNIGGRIREALATRAAQYLSRATLLDGPLRGSGEPIRALFIGGWRFATYVQERMFAEPPRVLSRRIIPLTSVPRLVKVPRTAFDLCMAVTPLRYDATFHGLCDLRCQEDVRQIIDLRGTWEEIRQRFSKRKRQYVANLLPKRDFGYRTSHNLRDLERFYHEMHAPHIRRRYGDLAELDSYETMRRWFGEGTLLFVSLDGQDLAGALLVPRADTLMYRRTGFVRDERDESGANMPTLLYHFVIQFARSENFQRLDTMLSRSFLNDGVYRHKREWGAGVYPDVEAESWVYFFLRPRSATVAEFFRQNPLVITEGQGLAGLLGRAETGEPTEAERREIAKAYAAPGLSRMMLLTPDAPPLIPVDLTPPA